MVGEQEILDTVCPVETCDGTTGLLCTKPNGDARDEFHVGRVRKAESIARDIELAGCLPEHDPERYEAAVAAKGNQR